MFDIWRSLLRIERDDLERFLEPSVRPSKDQYKRGLWLCFSLQGRGQGSLRIKVRKTVWAPKEKRIDGDRRYPWIKVAPLKNDEHNRAWSFCLQPDPCQQRDSHLIPHLRCPVWDISQLCPQCRSLVVYLVVVSFTLQQSKVLTYRRVSNVNFLLPNKRPVWGLSTRQISRITHLFGISTGGWWNVRASIGSTMPYAISSVCQHLEHYPEPLKKAN